MKTEITEGETYIPYNTFIGSMVPEWVERSTELSFGEKACFARLARFAGKDGKCFPSLRVIGEELGVSERQAKRLVGGLKAKGLIEARQRGLGTSNTYCFVANPMMQGAKLKDHDGTMNVTPSSLRVGQADPDKSSLSGTSVVPDQESIRESDQESHTRGKAEEESLQSEHDSKEELLSPSERVRRILSQDSCSPSRMFPLVSSIILEGSRVTRQRNSAIRSELIRLLEALGVHSSEARSTNTLIVLDDVSEVREGMLRAFVEAMDFLKVVIEA